MKMFTQYISGYLSQNKTVSLEKIGTFDLDNKESVFTYDKKAGTTPELVSFLAEKMGKPLRIVQQDLDYFLDQSRQLMNIRASSLVIGGLGYIYCNNKGVYEFSAGTVESQKESERKTFENAYANSPLTSSANSVSSSGNSKKILRWIAVVVIIGAVVAYAAYYIHNNPSFFKETDNPVAKTDTVKQENTIPQKDSVAKTVIPAAQSKGYKFILQTFPDKASALKRQAQLKEYRNIVFIDSANTNNTTQYRIFVTDSNALAKDTTHLKDSLKGYYGHPVTVE